MTKKLTKKDMFNYIRNIFVTLDFTPDEGMPTADDCIIFIDHELELLTNKTGGKHKPTKNQVENEAFKSLILDILKASDRSMRIREIQEAAPELEKVSNQRMSHLLSAMIRANLVVRMYEKKVPYYSAII